LEKEGLAEIRSDLANALAVHVNRHSKLLVRRELALDVTWPAASCRVPNALPQPQKLPLC